MGYVNTGFVRLDAATSRLQEIRDAHAARGLTTDPPTIEDAAIDYVVQTWRDEEADRDEFERIGAVGVREPLTLDLAEQAIGNIALPSELWGASEDHTIVVPIVDDEDAQCSVRRITVPITGPDVAGLTTAKFPGYAARKLAMAELGPRVDSASVVTAPEPRVPVGRVTPGERTTEFYLVADGVEVRGADTVAESVVRARQLAFAHAAKHPRVERIEVHGRIRRPDTRALAIVEYPAVTDLAVTLDAMVTSIDQAAPIIGYLVGFVSRS